jgi:predicted ATP-dependent endonuclease of OLD family
MHLKTVFIRFYKSFNDDFLRKNDGRIKPKPWEKIDGAFYPYIEVPIENQITTIVGANKSGKSHLLSAIEKAITGKKIERSDFCRYSPFFTVKQNELKYPDFGAEWANLSKLEDATIRKIIEVPDDVIFERFLVFRSNVDNLTIYLPEKGDYRPYKIEDHKAIELQQLLPEILKIESNVALPSSVPIKKLVELGQEDYLGGRRFELLDREQRSKIVDALDDKASNQTILDALQAVLLEFPDKDLQINKIGFARNVIRVVNEWSAEQKLSDHQINALQVFEQNFRVLFKKTEFYAASSSIEIIGRKTISKNRAT